MTSFILFLTRVFVALLSFQNCFAFILVFIVVSITFFFVQLNQVFEFNKGGIKLDEFIRFCYSAQAFGFYDKLVFEE